jgi:excisionase family DNA binding protein
VSAPATSREPMLIKGMGEQEIRRLAHILRKRPSEVDAPQRDLPRLVGSDGEEMALPDPIYQLFCGLIPIIKRGQPFFVFPVEQSLTTQEAADLLGMSRPYLKTLLDRGEIPYYRVGSHRRVKLTDLMDYREHREAERATQMDELLATSEEMVCTNRGNRWRTSA